MGDKDELRNDEGGGGSAGVPARRKGLPSIVKVLIGVLIIAVAVAAFV